MTTLKDRLIQVLIESKAVAKQQIDRVLDIHKKEGKPLKKVLIDEGIISEEDLLLILSRQLFIPTIHLSRYRIDSSLVSVVPERLARQYRLIPISRIGNTMTVAMSDPLNVFALDDLKALTGMQIDVVISSEPDILRAIDAQYHRPSGEMADIIKGGYAGDAGAEGTGEGEGTIELGELLEASRLPPIVKLVEFVLSDALKKRSSDIHFEPEEDCLRVRYRIDGLLHDIFRVPKKNQNAVLARLKIVSMLDITESRLPQDGRFKVRFTNKEVDFRVSALPTAFGQKFVLRALDKTNLSIGLDELGFSPEPLRLFREAVSRPYGMILITGPTGSGKSTTLYSILNQLNTIERNIVTIEDPVEYQIEGITQVQANPDIGLNFASGLRAILRQSPDTIMVGEIRDSETLDIAIKASLTGQMVFSTLHTNDSVSSITRMIDMGIEAFLVASSVIMVCAQRLCRKICDYCKEEQKIPGDLLARMKIDAKTVFYKGKGCNNCNDTGFYGRMGVLEVLMIDDAVREMIIRRVPTDEIRKYAIDKMGMKTLRDDALLKVKNGLTTLDEALRITSEE
ncbi:MAG: GspE/PulE family protein [Candidatus Omnitrophica bacterium]|nr:GspE/PulE family protein [Candidatus Omnitrophota bacterium]